MKNAQEARVSTFNLPLEVRKSDKPRRLPVTMTIGPGRRFRHLFEKQPHGLFSLMVANIPVSDKVKHDLNLPKQLEFMDFLDLTSAELLPESLRPVSCLVNETDFLLKQEMQDDGVKLIIQSVLGLSEKYDYVQTTLQDFKKAFESTQATGLLAIHGDGNADTAGSPHIVGCLVSGGVNTEELLKNLSDILQEKEGYSLIDRYAGVLLKSCNPQERWEPPQELINQLALPLFYSGAVININYTAKPRVKSPQ